MDLAHLHVTTTNGEVFTGEEHAQLAHLIWARWGKNYIAAHVAWKRLFENSASLSQFTSLVDSHK